MAGRLGRQNAMRNPKRTASTAAALMIGVALVGFIMTFASSAKASIGSAVDKDFRGDYVLESPGVTSTLATDLAARPEFSAVTSSRSAPAEVDGVAQTLSSWNAGTVAALFDVDPQQGDLATLGTDGIALEDSYAEAHGWTIGSQIPVTFSQGQTTLTVEAIFGEADWTGTAVIDHAVLDSFGMDAVDLNIYVQVADGVDAATAGRLLDEAALALPSVEVMDHDEFKASRSGEIDMILNLIYALLGLAIVIALIGITNTLALSIFERTRELGLLRAIGMTRGQLRATVRWESMIIALFGTGLGLTIGIFFGWTIVSALASQGFSEFVVPATSLAIVTAIAAIAGVAAAALPARRAARMDVLGAIATQ